MSEMTGISAADGGHEQLSPRGQTIVKRMLIEGLSTATILQALRQAGEPSITADALVYWRKHPEVVEARRMVIERVQQEGMCNLEQRLLATSLIAEELFMRMRGQSFDPEVEKRVPPDAETFALYANQYKGFAKLLHEWLEDPKTKKIELTGAGGAPLNDQRQGFELGLYVSACRQFLKDRGMLPLNEIEGALPGAGVVMDVETVEGESGE